jgi:hypothetical protein
MGVAERAPNPPARARLLAGLAEVCFSVVQRNALHPNDLTGLDSIRDPARRVPDPLQRNRPALTWTLFARADLNDALNRIDAHNKAQSRARAA